MPETINQPERTGDCSAPPACSEAVATLLLPIPVNALKPITAGLRTAYGKDIVVKQTGKYLSVYRPPNNP